MIDIHCHLLNHLDDGAQSLEESIAMAQQAVRNGFTDIIATPHHLKGSYLNDGDTVVEAVAAFNKELTQQQIPLIVHPGQEIALTPNLLQGLKNGGHISLAKSRYVLIEFPSAHIPLYTEELFRELKEQQLIPVIAHPERNQQLMLNKERLHRLLQMGALLQITWNSLMGQFGKRIKHNAEVLLAQNIVHFVATDAHDPKKRSLDIAKAQQVFTKKTTATQRDMIIANSQLLLDNAAVVSGDFKSIKPKRFLFF
ncbi:tyrosine-protein phosphatase [Brochothrix thermosphacta]|uniref:Tyrosine-protein phosphatase n=1 Tax=Brochothrix thermosphacta TaxID=2756 RepID=A0A2X0QJ57_BROTH|nr:CpsB/CapC family capsule biosynthesis tyrosine phosphatase [Brochothrix thermosphacta]SPP28223.1 protein tyrosine-phosphatase [Brochothrix thermosphacta]